MLWMITDLSRTPGLEKSIGHISNCLENGAELLTLRNKGTVPDSFVREIKDILDPMFPHKKIFIHDPDEKDMQRYGHFHYPSYRMDEACEIKKQNPSFTVAVSVHSKAEYEKAFSGGIDLALLSPVFKPLSKPDDKRDTVAPVSLKNLYLLGGIDRMKALMLIERGFINIAGISLFYGESSESVIKELSNLIMEKGYVTAYSN